MDFFLYVLAGAGVGFAVGLTGVGGGSLMTPLLLMFGFSPPVAIGTDLLYAAITKSGGAISHHRRGNVNWKIVLLLASGSLPSSVLVHFLLLNSNFLSAENFEELLTFSLGIMLIITAIILIVREKLRASAAREKPESVMHAVHSHRSAATVIMGISLGICVTLSSVGAGAFAAAVLMVIYTNTTTVKIIGSDIAHAVPLTFIAGLGYLFSGYVDFMLLGSLLVGSLPAIHFGSRLSSKVPDKALQRILIVLLMVLGSRYAFF